MSNRRLPVDQGWSWMVLVGSAISMALLGATVKSFGILFEEFIEVYNSSATITVTIVVAATVPRALISPLAGWLSDRFGIRIVMLVGTFFYGGSTIVAAYAPNITVVIIFYGIIQGTGMGVLLGPGQSAIVPYFKEKRGFAAGICMAGSSLGGMVFPLLIRYLTDTYALSGCLLIVGAIQFNMFVAAMLIRPVSFYEPPKKASYSKEQETPMINDSSDNTCDQSQAVVDGTACGKGADGSLNSTSTTRTSPSRKCCESNLLKNTQYLLTVLCIGVTVFSFSIQYLILPNLALEFGLSKQTAAVLMAIVSGTDLFGRLVLGYISDMHLIGRVTILQLSTLIMGVSGHLILLHPVFGVLVAYSVVYGLLGGIAMLFMVPLVADLVQPEQVSTAIGIIWMVIGASSTLANTITGVMRDATGTHTYSLRLFASTYLLSSLLWSFQRFTDWRQRRRRRKATFTFEGQDDRQEESAPL